MAKDEDKNSGKGKQKPAPAAKPVQPVVPRISPEEGARRRRLKNGGY